VRENVSQVYNSLMAEVAELTNKILANATAIAALEDAVEMLTDWALAHKDEYDDLVQLVTKHVADFTAQIEALQEEDGAIYDYIGKTATALNNLLDDANRTIQGLKDLCSEQQNQIGANKDAIYALNVLLDQIQADLGARLDALEVRVEKIEIDVETLKEAVAGLNETLEQAVADLKKEDKTMAATLQGLKDLCADFLNMIGENKDVNYAQAQQIAAIMIALEDINAELADNAEWQESMTTLTTQLNNAIANLWEALDLLGTTLQEDIAEAVALLTSEDAKIRAEIEAGLAEVLRLAYNNDSGVMDNVRMFEEKMSGIVDELRAAINNLANRVQSLVFVPDYSDHKAVIDWAAVEIINRQVDYQYTFIAKESVLRYRVYAKAGESAAEAAKDIADAWATNNDILSYEVEPVKKVYWTRSANVPAGLEVRNVVVNEENPEIIDVTVLAKNFIQEFFFENMEKYVADGELTEDEYQRPEKTSYSAAIVLSDGNNNRSSEYTNLVPGEPEIFGVAVADGTKQKDISFRTDAEAPRQLPYDLDSPDSVILLEDHSLVFIKPGSEDILYTPKEFMDLGYDLQLERRQHYTYPVNGSDYRVDGKPQVIELGVGDVKFEIHERDFVSEVEEGNTYVTLTRALTKEEYLSLEDKDLDIKFLYLVNGIEVWAQSTVEISNRLVEVNFSVDVPWTLETAIKTKNCTEDLTVPYTYDLAKAVKNNKSLEGYSLEAILKNVKSGDKHNGGHYDIALKNITADTFDVRLHSGSDKYAFPVNNEDSIEDYNTYSVSFISRFQDIDITINLNMNLGELAPVQKLSKDVKFTTAGENGWLYGYWNAIEDAYQKFLADGYIGYVDAPETGKAMFRAAFGDKTAYTLPPMLGVNADKVGHESNTNVPFTEFNNEAGEHMFKLSLGQLQADENGLVDGTTQTITQNFVNCYGMIPFVFTVNGTVDLPEYALDLDPVRAPNGHVDVYGEIKGEVGNGGVYTVDVSDLAKYYYVVNKAGVKDLKKGNAGDVVTVKFDLVSMAEGESGFEFEGEAGVVTNTLTVNFDKEEPYILPMGDAVATWGTYDHTHLGVVATLYVNGFKIGTKDIVLETKDPLDITFKDVNVTLSQKHGTNAEPTVAKIFSNFELTSTAEPNVENLFNTEAWTIAGIFKESQANVTYGAEIHAEFMRVYFINERGKAESWDKTKIQLGEVTADKLAAAPWLTEGEFDGTISISADDGNIQTPIYVDVLVKMKHRIHSNGGPCENEGIVTVKFVPEGYEE
ncbi:MAG: hypothetical protein IKU36_06485, partial [Bacteroidales bacterium]|nr:hypothetical protein [Bacteroidales bacterium]